jgi:hypothetical protein
MDGWLIALFGTDDYYEIDQNSEVSLSTLGTTDPMTDANWLKIGISGMSPGRENLNDGEERVGGIIAHSPTQKQIFEIHLLPLVFPDDMDKYEALCDLLLKKYIYLFKGTYSFDNWKIHPDGKAIRVAVNIETEHNYENGTKEITLQARKERPKL